MQAKMPMATYGATPWWFWVVAFISLVWNAGGAMDYVMTHFRVESYLAAFTEEQKAYFFAYPAWATFFWALGVWGCFAGSLLLLLRSKWAVHAFAASVIGLIGATIYQFTANMPDSLNTAFTWGFSAAIWIITLALLWFAMRMGARGILR